MTDKEKIADLLSQQPLYKKISVDTEFFNHPESIEELSFSFYCQIDKSHQTFKLTLEPEKFLKLEGGKLSSDHFNKCFDTFDEVNRKYKFTQHYSANLSIL